MQCKLILAGAGSKQDTEHSETMLCPVKALHRYKVPTWECILQETILFNTWSSQWDGHRYSEEVRSLIANIRHKRCLPPLDLRLRMQEALLLGQLHKRFGPGQPPLKPTVAVRTFQDRLFQELLAATDGIERIVGCKPRGFTFRSGDADSYLFLPEFN